MRIEGRVIVKVANRAGRLEVTLASNANDDVEGLVGTLWPKVVEAVLDECGLGGDYPRITVEVEA